MYFETKKYIRKYKFKLFQNKKDMISYYKLKNNFKTKQAWPKN